MSLEPWPSKAERPRWRRPGLLDIGIGGLIFVAGLADALIPDKVSQIPDSLRWGLFAGPLLAVVIWALRTSYKELRIVGRRVRQYPRLFALAEREKRRAERERARVHEMTFTLTTLVLHPELGHAIPFEMVDSVVSEEGVLLVLEAPEDVIPTTGHLLTVVDPQDGKWLGGLEATEQRTTDGKCLARVVEWDAVFLGHVRAKAERRESLQLRARAVYVVRSVDVGGG